MGKRSKKSKTKKQGSVATVNGSASSNGPSTSSGKKKSKFSVDQLMAKVEEYMDGFQMDMALKFCERAESLEPENVDILETKGIILLEMTEMENAKNCFAKCIQLSPEQGHTKYMYMGQLLTGQEAVQNFTKGIAIITQLLNSDSPDVQCTAQDLSIAHCNVAEIYLTDECFSEAAEEACKQHLDAALQAQPDNPEALQLLASYWISKQDLESAKDTIEKAVDTWLPAMREAAKSDGACADPMQVCQVPYPARVNAAKILMELEQYELATEVLELLLEEEDEIADVWYLLGWVNYMQGDQYKSNAKFYLLHAQKIITKIGCEDDGIVEHTQQLLKELKDTVCHKNDDDDGSVVASDSDNENGSDDDETNGDMEVDT